MHDHIRVGLLRQSMLQVAVQQIIQNFTRPCRRYGQGRAKAVRITMRLFSDWRASEVPGVFLDDWCISTPRSMPASGWDLAAGPIARKSMLLNGTQGKSASL